MDDNGKSILSALDDLRKHMGDPDPLEQKGIGKDWICCMGPQTYADLERQIKQNEKPYPVNSWLGAIDRVAMLVQRRVFVFDDIEYGRLEYTPWAHAYARDLNRMIEMRQVSSDELKPIDDDEGEVQS